MWEEFDRCSDTGKSHRCRWKFRRSSAQQPRKSYWDMQQMTTPHHNQNRRQTRWRIRLTSHSTIAILSRSSEMNISFWATWARSVWTFTRRRHWKKHYVTFFLSENNSFKIMLLVQCLGGDWCLYHIFLHYVTWVSRITALHTCLLQHAPFQHNNIVMM